jgi:hypothetical protein
LVLGTTYEGGPQSPPKQLGLPHTQARAFGLRPFFYYLLYSADERDKAGVLGGGSGPLLCVVSYVGLSIVPRGVLYIREVFANPLFLPGEAGALIGPLVLT